MYNFVIFTQSLDYFKNWIVPLILLFLFSSLFHKTIILQQIELILFNIMKTSKINIIILLFAINIPYKYFIFHIHCEWIIHTYKVQ